MAEKILVMGESGTGKSTSLRNCDPATTAIINPVGKPLPFRGSKKFSTLNGETDSDKICEFMKNAAAAGAKIIVVDDFQYILALPYMDRIKETGWDKYNDFGSNYFKIIDVCKELPDDVCVYYLTHCETLDSGLTTVKLIGKLLREKITIEGLFTIVLKTGVSEGKYYFFTQNDGKDTVKSPMGMFDTYAVDNDLKYIDSKIRNYYEFDNAESDSEMAKLDAEKAAPEVAKPERRSSRRAAKTEESAAEEKKPARGRRSRTEEAQKEAAKQMDVVDKIMQEAAEQGKDEVPYDELPDDGFVNIPDELELPFPEEPAAEEPVAEEPVVEEKKPRRTRKTRE